MLKIYVYKLFILLFLILWSTWLSGLVRYTSNRKITGSNPAVVT